MAYKITNLRNDRLYNFGCRNGKTLMVEASRSIVITEEMYNLFNSDIERALIGNFISLEKVDEVEEPIKSKKEVVNSQTANVAKEKKKRKRK
jgi:hypothetical protein